MIEKLGSGAYGTVHIVKKRFDGSRKVLKKVADSNNNSEQIIKEMELIKYKTECPYVLLYTDLFKENLYCFFISDHCEVRNLIFFFLILKNALNIVIFRHNLVKYPLI